MNRREVKAKGKGHPSSRDLMVCFPTRAHLRLMPKSVSSPRRIQYHQNHLRKSIKGGHASPYLWSGSTKQMNKDNSSEPTSPKVTCAGQIKVRPSTRSCKNWQTVMEEIERLHNRKKKPSNWVATLGFKKEIMQFLTCLRRIKLDFHCLGGFSHVDIDSDDEDEDSNDKEIVQDQDQDDEHDEEYEHDDKDSRTVFSKWFMVLQEDKDCGVFEKEEKSLKLEGQEDLPCLPPANALFLMRCRSAPAKSWMEEKQEEEEEEEDHDKEEEEDHDKEEEDHDKEEEKDNVVINDDDDKKIEKKENKRKSLMELMKTESDFYKLSCDIAKETWVIGGIHKDPFSRSRSWKR